jgi:hypothetical protein
MKIRSGYVSNSSSSSFLIPINALQEYQISMIEDHITVTEHWNKYHEGEEQYCPMSERWSIEVNDKCLYGYTFMNNFDMQFFLERIAMINEKYVFWGRSHGDNDLDLDELNREILKEERKDKLDNIEGRDLN